MKIGFVGLGKLGLPVSLAVEDKGHKIFGYDISKQTINDIKNRKIRYKEEWVEKYLPKTSLEITDINDLVNKEALVIPNKTGLPEAGVLFWEASSSFFNKNSYLSISSPGIKSLSPISVILTFCSICLHNTSICLSFIKTPCNL